MHRGIVQDPKAAPLVFPGAALKSLLRCEMKEGRKEGGRKEGRKEEREGEREGGGHHITSNTNTL